jgi:predicted nucleotidyltransferase
MEIEIKKAVKSGNSSAVILPRAWLNQEVRVELVKKTTETIFTDVMSILRRHINLEEIIGVYLVGSYARQEESKGSDIDILVISENMDKEMIIEGIYNILIVSKELLNQKLETSLFPVGSMIKEAKPLINSNYLKSLDVRVTRNNVKWYLDTTKEKIELIKKSLEHPQKIINNKIVYTLILRIRTLHMIEKMIKVKNYSKKEFLNLIKRISGSQNAYKSYLSIKNNLEEDNITTKQEAGKLLDYLEKQLDNIKKELGYF